ncbi:hypothetical protein LJR164_001598 [Phenylobacterium sp. LjRoot164]
MAEFDPALVVQTLPHRRVTVSWAIQQLVGLALTFWALGLFLILAIAVSQ